MPEFSNLFVTLDLGVLSFKLLGVTPLDVIIAGGMTVFELILETSLDKWVLIMPMFNSFLVLMI